jgi:hypothetical protein
VKRARICDLEVAMFPIRACVAKCATLALLCLMPASAHSQGKSNLQHAWAMEPHRKTIRAKPPDG